MKSNYPRSIAFVFQYEGGYTNNPKDPGGPTNWGITIADARKYWKSNASASDVKAMPKSVASDIYFLHYAKPVSFDDLAPGLDVCTLDSAVNSGVGRADKWLAYAIGAPSGRTYAQLAALSQGIPPAELPAKIKAFCAKRLSFLHSLRTWPTFGKGWGRRVAALEVLGSKFAHEADGKTPAEISKEFQKEASSTKAKTKKDVQVGTAGSAATTASVWQFWQWDVPHIMAGLVLLVAAFFLIKWLVLRYQASKARTEAYTEAATALATTTPPASPEAPQPPEAPNAEPPKTT